MSNTLGRRAFIGGLAAAGAGTACSVTPAAPEKRTPVSRGSGLTAQNTYAEVEAVAPELAIFSLSAIEQHGDILPVGCDFFRISAVVREMAKRLNAYVLPTFPVGCSREHMAKAGSLTVHHTTLMNYVRDIITSLYDQGFRYVAYMTGHGGNFMAEPVFEELNREYPDRICASVIPRGGPPIMESTKPDIHGGEGELSDIMYLFPEDAHPEKSVDTFPPVGREVFDYAYVPDFSNSGIWGAPSLASAEKGRQMFEADVEAAIEVILTLFPEIERRKRGGA